MLGEAGAQRCILMGCGADGGAEAGIHLVGMGSPTEVQIYSCWAFHVNKALHIQALSDPASHEGPFPPCCESGTAST